MSASDSDRWLVTPRRAVRLADRDPRRHERRAGRQEGDERRLLEELAERARRRSRSGCTRSPRQALLVVLQAMDAGGKDGTIKHVFRGVNPQGVRVTSFKQPTPEELAHDFLWRIHANDAAPRLHRDLQPLALRGRARSCASTSSSRSRCGAGATGHINHFEALLHDADTRVVKLFLHISREEQAERLRARLDDPTKRWKFNPGDLAERERWDEYSGRLRGGDPADLDRARAVVRRPGRPQVVPQLGREPHRDRDARGHGPALPRARRRTSTASRSRERVGACRVIFRQLIHDDLGCASYLVGDEHAGVAAVVDPKLEVDDYLRLARFLGVAIDHVLETHTHADHVSGPRPPAGRDRRDDPRPPRRRRRLRARAVRRRLGARARRRARPRAAHARPPPRAHGVRADRRPPRRRTAPWARPHRRQPVRRRPRPPRPRDRARGRRARHLPLAPRAAADAARRHRGLARAPRRLACAAARGWT